MKGFMVIIGLTIYFAIVLVFVAAMSFAASPPQKRMTGGDPAEE